VMWITIAQFERFARCCVLLPVSLFMAGYVLLTARGHFRFAFHQRASSNYAVRRHTTEVRSDPPSVRSKTGAYLTPRGRCDHAPRREVVFRYHLTGYRGSLQPIPFMRAHGLD